QADLVFLCRDGFGATRSVVAHLLGARGVGGSNPLAPTLEHPAPSEAGAPLSTQHVRGSSMGMHAWRWGLAVLVLLAVPAAPADGGTAAVPEVDDRLVQSRAVEAVIWGIPVVNSELMAQEAMKAGGEINQFVYWSRPADWKNQTLTPNPDSIYFMCFYSTK